MSAFFCILKRTLDQCRADAMRAERRLDSQRPEQQSRRFTDADWRKPNRADHQCSDACRERQIESMGPTLANTESRARETAGPERALVQALDCRRVGGGFRQDRERGLAHGRQLSVSGAAA